MSRKTFNVEEFKNAVNTSLAQSLSEYCPPAQRQGMMNVLEMMLHQTGNYRGFTYLTLDEVPNGELPGIVIHGTIEDTPIGVRFAAGYTDKTRVRYF